DDIILRTPAILYVVIALRADRPAPRHAKCSARCDKLNFRSRGIDLIERNRIPYVSAAYTIPIVREALPHFEIPVVGLLNSEIRVELAHRRLVGIEKCVDGEVLVDGRYLAGASPEPLTRRCSR